MRIQGKQTSWIIAGQAADLAQHAALAAGAGPQGQEALKLTVDIGGPIEAYEERSWAVSSGRAYQLTLQTRTALARCHGQAFLVWLNADDQVISEAATDYTFAAHAYAPLVVSAVAPPEARAARSVFRLVADRWPDLKGVQGDLWLSAAQIEPSLAVTLQHIVPGALYDAGAPVEYKIEIRGALPALETAELHYTVANYERETLLTDSLHVQLSAGGGAAALSLPRLAVGYYTLQAAVSAPGLAAVHLTRTFGCLAALDFNPVQDSPIALDAGISWPFVQGLSGQHDANLPARFTEQAQACYNLGLRTLRDRFSWGDVNPDPDTFDWGRYRRAANIQHAAGLDVYQMQSSVPEWTLDPTENDTPPGNYPPAEVRMAYDFGLRLAAEMGHAVRFWEFWNEPDIFFYGGHPWDLAAFTKAGALGIKDVDPTLGVLGGSRCNTTEFWEKWLANGVGAYIDIFNQHSYGKPEDLFALIQQDREIMAEVGLERPVWMTEMGQRSSPSADGSYTLAEQIQVVYLLRAYACGLAAGLDRFFYFYLQEFLEAGIHLWGLQRQDLSPKPAVLALGALVRAVGQASVVGTLIDDERYCVVFERLPGDYTAMLWSTKNTVVVSGWDAALPNLEPGQDWTKVDGSFDLPVTSGAHLLDALGRQGQACSGDTVHVDLSLCPIFLRGIDPSRMALTPPPPTPHYAPAEQGLSAERHTWLQARARPNQPRPKQADAQAQKNALHIQPGKSEQIAFTIHNYTAERARVSLVLEEPQGWQIQRVTLQDGSSCSERPVALQVEGSSTQQVLVEYLPVDVAAETESRLAAWLYLDGAPHDQVAVYYKQG